MFINDDISTHLITVYTMDGKNAHLTQGTVILPPKTSGKYLPHSVSMNDAELSAS